MLQSYLWTWWRSVTRHRLSFGLQVAGLAIGLAGCLALWLLVRYEINYDRWRTDHASVFALQTRLGHGDEPPLETAMVPMAAAAAVAKDVPGAKMAYAINASPVFQKTGDPITAKGFVTDQRFLEVLPVPLDAAIRSPLAAPGSLVLSPLTAEKLFGTRAAIGRTIEVRFRDQAVPLRVTAILAGSPGPSAVAFDFLANVTPNHLGLSEEMRTSWSAMNGYAFLQLATETDATELNNVIQTIVTRSRPRSHGGHDGGSFELRAVPLADLHLLGFAEEAITPPGSLVLIGSFAAIAALILLVAVLNYSNLATAEALRRTREVAVRKALGATDRQVATQFVVEAALTSAIAALVACAVVELALPAFASVAGAELQLVYWGSDSAFGAIVVLAGLAALAGGLYPAVRLARLRAGAHLRVGAGATSARGAAQSLIILAQFAVSTGLMIATAIVYAQTRHVVSSDPGFARDEIVVVDHFRPTRLRIPADTTLDRFAHLDGVVAAAASDAAPPQDSRQSTDIQVPGVPPFLMDYQFVSPGFFRAMGIPILAGREFSRSAALDDSTVDRDPATPDEDALVRRGMAIVLNASAAAKLGLGTPAEAVGRTVRARLAYPSEAMVPATVVGVVGDTRYRSARDAAAPTVYAFGRHAYYHMLLRAAPGRAGEVRAAAEAAWRQLVPEVPATVTLADADARALYDQERAQGLALAAFAGLAIALSLLGLYGLAAFMARERTKEVGIRKVFGAATRDIARLMLGYLLRPVVAANLVAWPAAWLVMRHWLNGFADRIELSIGWFVLAGLAAVIVAVATVAGQIVTLARTRPATALRHE